MFIGQEVHYYMVYIAYFTELSLQICYYAQKRRICCENCNYALDERFHGHFCPRRKPAKSCHPGRVKNVWTNCPLGGGAKTYGKSLLNLCFSEPFPNPDASIRLSVSDFSSLGDADKAGDRPNFHFESLSISPFGGN